jgi:hypothetical protein
MKTTLLLSLLRGYLMDLLPLLKAYIDGLFSPYKSKIQVALDVLKILDEQLLEGKFSENSYYDRVYSIAKELTDQDGVDTEYLADVAKLAVNLFSAKVLDAKKASKTV